MIIATFSIIDDDKVRTVATHVQNMEDEEQFIKEIFNDPRVIHVEAIHYVPEDMPLIMDGRRIWH